MGISLAGHRDRNKMACFIAGINPKGLAAQSDLKVGDEILEVIIWDNIPYPKKNKNIYYNFEKCGIVI